MSLLAEAHVLATAADRLGQLVLGHRDIHGVLFLVHDDRLHFGRRHRIDDVLGLVLVPQDDVDALAVEFVRHGLHARTAHADACTDGIGTGVVRDDGDLGAVARIAGTALDLDEALADFRHFELEQFDHELRRAARNEQLRTTDFRLHFIEVTAHAVADAGRFAGNRLVARDERLGIAAQVEIDVAALDALDDTRDQLAHAVGEGIDHLLALGLADALHDDLLRGPGGDTAEFGVLDLVLDGTTDLGDFAFTGFVFRVHQADLVGRILHLAVVRDDFPATEGLVVAGVTVDLDADVRVFIGVALLGGRGQRRFHGFENDFARHALLVGDRVDYQQKFFAHLALLP